MTRIAWLFILAAALAISAVLAFPGRSGGDSTSLVAYLESDAVPVIARAEGIVRAVPVSNGTRVEFGELLVEIDDSPYREKLAALGRAADRMRLMAAAEQLAARGAEKQRIERSYVDALTRYESAPSERTKAELDRVIRLRDGLFRNAGTALSASATDPSIATSDALRAAIEGCKVTSQSAGIVEVLNTKVGARVAAGQVLALVAQDTPLHVVAYVNGADRARWPAGTQVNVKASAGSSTTGEVVRLEPANLPKIQALSRSVMRAVVRLRDTSSDWRPGDKVRLTLAQSRS